MPTPDAPVYRVERFEDVAVVVDAVANTSGPEVDLRTPSEALPVRRGDPDRQRPPARSLRGLAAGGPWGGRSPSRSRAAPGRTGAGGQTETVFETLVRDLLMAIEADLSALRSQPSWPSRVAAAHTLTREIRVAVDSAIFDPQQAARITVPTLLLIGEDSTDPSRLMSRQWRLRCPTPGSGCLRVSSTRRGRPSPRGHRPAPHRVPT